MRLDSSRKAFSIFQNCVAKDVEEFWVAALNSQLMLLQSQLLFRGTVDRCPLHPRDLIRFVCEQNASSFVIAHNHPSGDPKPSFQDYEITRRLFHLSRILEIPMNDHLILAQETYFSFADYGVFNRFAKQKSLSLRPMGSVIIR